MLELLTHTGLDLAQSAARHGEGLFETLRIRDGQPLRLALHLQRLAAGAAFLGLPAPPEEAVLRQFLASATPCPELASGVLRLVAVDGQLRVWAQAWQPEPVPVAVAVSQATRRFSASPLNRFKTLSYLENRLLAREAEQRGLFDVIAANERGRLSDGGRSSLFLVLDGQLVTPPADDGALPGVARRVLLEAGLARERTLTPEHLEQAAAALLTNSLRGAMPVAVLEGRALAERHPLLAAAVQLLDSETRS